MENKDIQNVKNLMQTIAMEILPTTTNHQYPIWQKMWSECKAFVALQQQKRAEELILISLDVFQAEEGDNVEDLKEIRREIVDAAFGEIYLNWKEYSDDLEIVKGAYDLYVELFGK